MNTPAEIRKQLWRSLDLQCLRRDLVMVCIVVPLVLLPSGCAVGFQYPGYWRMAAMVFAIVMLPMAGYGLWLILRVYRSSEYYTFYEAKLVQPHGSWYVRAMYFTVVLEDPENGTFFVNTRPIFQTYGLFGPMMEDYLNKTVTIAYNEESGNVVVIG